MKHPLPTKTIGGLPVCVLTRKELARVLIEDWHQQKKSEKSRLPKLVFSANGESISQNASNPVFAGYMSAADVIHADGQSLILFSQVWPGRSLPDRICTTDFYLDVADVAAEHGLTFYLLGGTEEVNAGAVTVLKERWPMLEIVGHRNGYFNDSEVDDIIADIKRTNPDVVWVGLGRPKQEKFCLEAREQLQGVTWLKTCGGLFDYIAGVLPRAPHWMQAAGLEWLYRLAHEPRRLFKRYLITNIHALFLFVTRTDFD